MRELKEIRKQNYYEFELGRQARINDLSLAYNPYNAWPGSNEVFRHEAWKVGWWFEYFKVVL